MADLGAQQWIRDSRTGEEAAARADSLTINSIVKELNYGNQPRLAWTILDCSAFAGVWTRLRQTEYNPEATGAFLRIIALAYLGILRPPLEVLRARLRTSPATPSAGPVPPSNVRRCGRIAATSQYPGLGSISADQRFGTVKNMELSQPCQTCTWSASL